MDYLNRGGRFGGVVVLEEFGIQICAPLLVSNGRQLLSPVNAEGSDGIDGTDDGTDDEGVILKGEECCSSGNRCPEVGYPAADRVQSIAYPVVYLVHETTPLK